MVQFFRKKIDGAKWLIVWSPAMLGYKNKNLNVEKSTSATVTHGLGRTPSFYCPIFLSNLTNVGRAKH